MKQLLLGSIVLALACTGSDKNITTTNQAPEADITSHSDGEQIPEGVMVLFTGSVSDTNHALEDLLVTWYAGTEYTGVIMIHGLRWVCSGGTCILKGALRQWFEHEGMPGTIGKGRWAEILL